MRKSTSSFLSLLPSDYIWERSVSDGVNLTVNVQVHQGSEEGNVGQEDISVDASVDYVLRVSSTRISSNLHRRSSRPFGAARRLPKTGVSLSQYNASTMANSLSHPALRLFIQLPVDLSDDPELVKLEEKGTRGHYTSVESLKELEDGRVEWRMATSSTPGGRIPNFIVESSMAGQIAAVSLVVSLVNIRMACSIMLTGWVAGCPSLPALVPQHQAQDHRPDG